LSPQLSEYLQQARGKLTVEMPQERLREPQAGRAKKPRLLNIFAARFCAILRAKPATPIVARAIKRHAHTQPQGTFTVCRFATLYLAARRSVRAPRRWRHRSASTPTRCRPAAAQAPASDASVRGRTTLLRRDPQRRRVHRARDLRDGAHEAAHAYDAVAWRLGRSWRSMNFDDV
jgi:hypothetical protein